MKYTEQEIQQIVQQVVNKTLSSESSRSKSDETISNSCSGSRDVTYGSQKELEGVFDQMSDAIDAAHNTYLTFWDYSMKDRQRFIDAIKKLVLDEKHKLARMVVDETKLGNYEDKVTKHELAAMTYGTEILSTTSKTGDTGIALIEMAPFGVIGATTPVTNPTETIINNTISMVAAGNTVVYNVHPSSKYVCTYLVDKINRVIQEVGGPENVITMVKNPTMESLNEMSNSPKINLLVGTGGPGLVRALLKSGKKAIGAGAGNPPVVVDETAIIDKAARDIITGHSFDNNIVCILEKEVFVVDKVANELIENMKQNNAFYISKEQVEKLMELILEEDRSENPSGCSYQNRKLHIKKQWVGTDAYKYLEEIGVDYKTKPKCIICEVDFNHPFVQLELLMPILPIVRVRNVDEGIDMAVKAEHGNRHTAMMHSQNINNITKYAKAINTTIFVKNAPSLAGLGVNSEGVISYTIAGPTGEGITTAKTFTRARHCVLVDGFRII
ncbi:MAG: aldehyde dehydrogenase family protein [Eubacteriales bacterium]